MLPDFGWSELLVIGIVLIVVVGPKDLPRVIKGIGKGVKSVRKMSSDFQRQFSQAMDEADMADIKNTINDVRSLDPRRQIREAMKPLDDEAKSFKSDWAKSVETINKATKVDAPKPASAVDDALAAASAKAKAAQSAGDDPGAIADSGKAAAPKTDVTTAAAKQETSTPKDVPAKKAPAKKAPAKRAPAKKTAAAKPAATRTAAKKPAVKKAATRKPAANKDGDDA